MKIDVIQRQSLISLTWQIVFTFIGFLSTIYFAHTLGAGVLGAYFLFISYLSIISFITDGGFGAAAVKRISEGEEESAYFSAYLLLKILFVCLVLVLLLIFRRYFVDLDGAGVFVWLLIALIVSIFQGAVGSGIVGRGKIGINATGDFVNNLIRIIVQVIAVFLGYGIAGLAGGFVIGMIVGALVQLPFFELKFAKFGLHHLKSLSRFSFWVFLISSGFIVLMHTDRIMIGYFLDTYEVGIYAVIISFTSLAMFVTSALNSTLWPKVSRWAKIGDILSIEKSLSKALIYSLTFAIPLVVGGILLGDRLLYFFYGEEFVRYEVLVILLATNIVNIFYFFFTSYLGAMDHLKKLFKIMVIAVLANIILNAILIPIIGIIGAGIATFVTMLVSTFLSNQVISKIIIVRLDYESGLNILKAAFIMAFFVGTYRLLVPLTNLWLTLVPVILGGVIYWFLILKFDNKIYQELKTIINQITT